MRRVPLAFTFGLCLCLLGLQPLTAQTATSRVAERAEPIDAAISLTNRIPNGAATALVIGRDDVFADNLAGTALTSVARPLLLTTGGAGATLPDAVGAEVRRLLGPPGTNCDGGRIDIYVLGGSGAVSAETVADLVDMDYCVARLAGPDRIQTALAIAREVRQLGGTTDVVIARADDWADAATAGAWAAANAVPVVITDTNRMHQDVRDFLADSGSGTAWVMGGTAALSSAVEDDIPSRWAIRRVQGSTRQGTAVSVLDQMWGTTSAVDVAILNGYAPTGWAYAFAAGWFSAQRVAPQVYANQDGSLPAQSREVINRVRPDTVIAVGTTTLVTDQALQDAAAAADAPPSTNPPPAALATFRPVYVVPADRDAVEGREAAIAATMEQVGGWYEEQTGMRPRVARDEEGLILVETVDSPLLQAQLVDAYVTAVASLRASPLDVPVVWAEALDADGPCGYTAGDGVGLFVVMEMDNCEIYPTSDDAFPFGATYLTAHEMAHAFGAVPVCAPNHDGTGHTNDDERDLLSGIGRDFDNVLLDPGNDDYYNHGRDDCLDIVDSPLWDQPQ